MEDGMAESMEMVNRTTNTGVMNLKQVTDRVNIVHQVLSSVMQEGTHYGKVPGCGAKMVLLKPGADVLAMTFRLVPQFAVTRTEMDNGHREYDVTCSMYGPDGALLGQGVGSCCTMEKKYRYRNGVENEDIADVYNTVLKMAKKRAHIDATLTVTGAADLFTQDLIDDDADTSEARKPVSMPKVKKKDASGPVQDAEVKLTGMVVKMASKDGKKKNGGTFTRYGIQIDDGGSGEPQWFSTFDSAINETAAACERDGIEVSLSYTAGKFGKDIVTLEPCDPPEQNQDDTDDLPL